MLPALQFKSVKINFLQPTPVHVDGEPWQQAPGEIVLQCRDEQVLMLKKYRPLTSAASRRKQQGQKQRLSRVPTQIRRRSKVPEIEDEKVVDKPSHGLALTATEAVKGHTTENGHAQERRDVDEKAETATARAE